jgi:hypothetical protein
MPADGSMVCPRGIVFQHVAGHASRWRLAVAFRGRSSAAAFHGPGRSGSPIPSPEGSPSTAERPPPRADPRLARMT